MKAANTGCETSELTISLASVNKAKPDMKYVQLGGYVCVCVCARARVCVCVCVCLQAILQ